MPTLVLHEATLFDSTTGELRPHASVAVDGDRIAEVSYGTTPLRASRAGGAAGQRGEGVQVAEPSPRRRRVPFQQPQLRSLGDECILIVRTSSVHKCNYATA